MLLSIFGAENKIILSKNYAAAFGEDSIKALTYLYNSDHIRLETQVVIRLMGENYVSSTNHHLIQTII
jgi:hypothetical protein